MVEIIGEAATLEMLAEECTELAQAALKLARIIRGENYTPDKEDKIRCSVMEEWADVLVCSEYFDEMEWFDHAMVNGCMRHKKRRAMERIENARSDCFIDDSHVYDDMHG